MNEMIQFTISGILTFMFYQYYAIMCLKNIVMCFKGKIALLKVLLIIFAFIIMTYVIMY